MGRRKNSERNGSAELAGHAWLMEWGAAEQVNTGDYATANVLWLARMGRGGNDGKTPPLPAHLAFVPRAIDRLPNMQLVWIANHKYIWREHNEDIAIMLQISLSTFNRLLRDLQVWVASAAQAQVEMSIKTA